MRRDSRDGVIEELANNERELARQCAQLREALHAAIAMLHQQQGTIDRLRAEYRRALEALRRLRQGAGPRDEQRRDAA